jgi:MoaA/NifB/PqqE/SkfB family radical SAM enzyme
LSGAILEAPIDQLNFIIMKNLNEIPVVFENQFPVNFVNDLNGWNFTQKELNDNKGKILTLDIDLGNTCSLNCPHCFRRTAVLDKVERKMTFEETKALIVEAKKLGLRSIKFLGAGEPFENVRFVEFLRFLKSQDVIPVIFTKGHVIGDDKLAERYNHRYGIINGVDLVKVLNEVNASIILGFNSFNTELQEKMVGEVKGYVEKRNLALTRLVEGGLNQSNPTRLCIGSNPVTLENYDEIFNIYQWGKERNIYVLVTPTMVGGKACAWQEITPSKEKLIDLYTKIYKFNLERGIQTIEQLEKEGISAYAGSHPCNQVACGMYVTLSGKVLRCPGNDTTILGNIFEKSLEEIWINSENFKRSGTFNCGCPPKIGKSIPSNLFTGVLKRVRV